MVKTAAFILLLSSIVESRLILPYNHAVDSFSDAAPSSWDDRVNQVLDFVSAQHAQSGSPGWALSVVHGNDTLISQGFGVNEFGNPSNPVTQDSMFQIGSVSKTMLTVGFATLVDSGRLKWTDTVKQHLPWFELVDKYAEKYTTLADLLAMNSVFGEGDGEMPQCLGVFKSERDQVEKLKFFPTDRSFRQGYDYSNMNFVILGQVLATATNQTWGEYLVNAVFKPLGMHNTFPSAVGTSLSSRAFGHYVCDGKVAGPFDVAQTKYSGLQPYGNAAGSIVSSIHDMAIFSKFLLHKGQPLLQSSQAISDMITGHEIQTMFAGEEGVAWGYHFHPSGGALGAGYGLDVVGTGAMYPGVDYFDKNGDTATHQTRTAFVPSHNLGLVLFNNGQLRDKGSNVQRLSHVRSYALGLLLGLPRAQLQAAWDASVAAADATPAEPCDAHIYDHAPWVPSYVLTLDDKAWLRGTYKATVATEYNGQAIVYDSTNGTLHLKYGDFDGPLVALSKTAFAWDIFVMGASFLFDVAKNASGGPVINIGYELVKVA
ncbi:Aste57867_3222 [Aphanomyces stellatus]|uniref:Aste57867_3222 protein n=1 Tax=Aphanomyces stellatus TaxID=120398 RepID=A0A485KEQ0_9STRA|nr:hypothetical protein As57867_003212 [Aphanomyces stellatus]VFT80396.1 Aste57867_3222 [Aphanomyces stellatus]